MKQVIFIKRAGEKGDCRVGKGTYTHPYILSGYSDEGTEDTL
jgi:hypothetical protein